MTRIMFCSVLALDLVAMNCHAQESRSMAPPLTQRRDSGPLNETRGVVVLMFGVFYWQCRPRGKRRWFDTARC
jgi:hypothetical protein